MTYPYGPFLDSAQKLEFCNNSKIPLEIMVEMIPNRYVLQPGDSMYLVADNRNAPRDEGFSVNYYEAGIQIYAAWDWEPVVYINGEIAEPDWNTPIASP